MKNKNLVVAILVFFTLILTSCSGDKKEDLTKELLLSTAELSIAKGAYAHVEIKSGNGAYKVSVSNHNVKAEVENENGEVEIHVDALKVGKSIVTVTDAEGKTAKFTVLVQAHLKLSATELSIAKGAYAHVKIESGNGDYKVSASNDNVKAEVENENGEVEIHVDALKVGGAVIKVTDAVGETLDIVVSVVAPEKKYDVAFADWNWEIEFGSKKVTASTKIGEIKGAMDKINQIENLDGFKGWKYYIDAKTYEVARIEGKGVLKDKLVKDVVNAYGSVILSAYNE